MSDERDTSSLVAESFEITPDGVYIDGHKLPAADEINVEHVAPDFHVVSLKLYTKTFTAADHHRLSKTPATVHHYVHDAPGGTT